MNGLPGLRFHHFGLAAVDPVRAAAFVSRLGYECEPPVFDPLQNVHLRWCRQDGAPSVEIVSPADSEGPLGRILAGQSSSFYHLCYEIDVETSTALGSLRAGGIRIVTVVEPRPAVLFGGRRVSFHVVQGFGLVELLESTVVTQV